MAQTTPPTSNPPDGMKRSVAILGATGAVGQAFIRLLTHHPWFDISDVAASERSAGKTYGELVRWIGGDAIPEAVAGKTIQACDPAAISADIAFSALDSSVAGEVEAAFAKAGKLVLSNAKNYRMEPDVPLVIAEVNPDHLRILDAQRARRGWKRGGGIVTNGNCSAIVATLAAAPIHEHFGITDAFVSTMQAVSGAGYPGVPSLDILGNVIPFIKDEEEKLEAELCKFLGSVNGDGITSAPMKVSAHCNRVPVENGHTVCMSLRLRQRARAEDVEDALRAWRGADAAQGLPTAPARPLVVADASDRPQPRRDVGRGAGMTVTVGRVRSDPVFDVKLVAMGDNIIRGAAGASVLNAELMANCGMLPR